MTKLSIVVLAIVLGVAVALPQGYGSQNYGSGNYGSGNYGGGNFGGGNGGAYEVDTFQRLPGGGFIEDEKITR